MSSVRLRFEQSDERHLAAVDIPTGEIAVEQVTRLDLMNDVVEADVAAINVAQDVWHEQAVIEGGVENALIGFCSAGNVDDAEGLVPCGLCAVVNLVEGLAGGFGFEVVLCASEVNVGDADLRGDGLWLR